MGTEAFWVPVLLGAGGAIAAKSLIGGDSGAKLPSQTATTAKKTAAPVEQLSDTARRNRRRASAFRPRGFAPPKLGQPGLLGVSGQL